MNGKKKIYASLIGFLVIALVSAALIFNKKSAPDFVLTTLDGKTVSRSDLIGKVTLVNFWATTCSGCIEEMPLFVKTHEVLSPTQKFQIVAVAMKYDPENQVRQFTEKNHLPFIVGLDKDGLIADAFGGVQLTPTTFVIDKKGNISKTFVGVPTKDEVLQIIDAELEKS